jgi:L-cysteine desulfidase
MPCTEPDIFRGIEHAADVGRVGDTLIAEYRRDAGLSGASATFSRRSSAARNATFSGFPHPILRDNSGGVNSVLIATLTVMSVATIGRTHGPKLAYFWRSVDTVPTFTTAPA